MTVAPGQPWTGAPPVCGEMIVAGAGSAPARLRCGEASAWVDFGEPGGTGRMMVRSPEEKGSSLMLMADIRRRDLSLAGAKHAASFRQVDAAGFAG
jgi:hypothetical protein